ncbi:hypothetical protein B0H13DRAFT_2273461 [Mycena leptocephala]|nr:hypothetical protein B0H13DRAFT_2273461 [Mycena leptocephala]
MQPTFAISGSPAEIRELEKACDEFARAMLRVHVRLVHKQNEETKYSTYQQPKSLLTIELGKQISDIWQTTWGRHGLLSSLVPGTPGRLILSILSETNVFKTISGFGVTLRAFGLREDFT